MENKTKYIYSDKECKLKYIPELPEQPNPATCDHEVVSYRAQLIAHSSILKHAKDNAIVIANKDTAYNAIVETLDIEAIKHGEDIIKKDTIYPIEGYEVEVDAKECPESQCACRAWEPCRMRLRVAYIKPIQKEEPEYTSSDIKHHNPNYVPEEIEAQEELWKEVKDKAYSSPWFVGDLINYMKDHFIISRKIV